MDMYDVRSRRSVNIGFVLFYYASSIYILDFSSRLEEGGDGGKKSKGTPIEHDYTLTRSFKNTHSESSFDP